MGFRKLRRYVKEANIEGIRQEIKNGTYIRRRDSVILRYAFNCHSSRFEKEPLNTILNVLVEEGGADVRSKREYILRVIYNGHLRNRIDLAERYETTIDIQFVLEKISQGRGHYFIKYLIENREETMQYFEEIIKKSLYANQYVFIRKLKDNGFPVAEYNYSPNTFRRSCCDLGILLERKLFDNDKIIEYGNILVEYLSFYSPKCLSKNMVDIEKVRRIVRRDIDVLKKNDCPYYIRNLHALGVSDVLRDIDDIKERLFAKRNDHNFKNYFVDCIEVLLELEYNFDAKEIEIIEEIISSDIARNENEIIKHGACDYVERCKKSNEFLKKIIEKAKDSEVLTKSAI